MTATAAELAGKEYDWLGCDLGGCIALFSTAGAGYAPVQFLRDTDAHDAAIRVLLALPATTHARFAPVLGPEVINTWRAVAERGLYAYDCDPNGGPYRLVASPVAAASIRSLPASVAELAAQVRCAVRFDEQSVVSEAMLRP